MRRRITAFRRTGTCHCYTTKPASRVGKTTLSPVTMPSTAVSFTRGDAVHRIGRRAEAMNAMPLLGAYFDGRGRPSLLVLSHVTKKLRHPDQSRAQRGAVEGPILLKGSLDCAARQLK